MFTTSNSLDSLFPALFKAQEEFPPVLKESNNPRFKSKYANLENVVETLQPILRKHNLMIIQPCSSDFTGLTGVTTTLLHASSGQFIAESFGIPSSAPGRESADAQSAVAAITYARRVGYLSILGIVPEDADDDGNTATPRVRTQSVQAQPARKAGRPRKEAYVESTKPAGHGPEPAVIPSLPQAPVSGEPVPLKAGNLYAGSLPTEAEKKKFLKQAGDLIEKLQEAGLGEKDGLSAGKRLGRLFKKRNKLDNEDSIDKLTKEDWVSFFKNVDEVVAEGGYARMVQVVEQSEKS